MEEPGSVPAPDRPNASPDTAFVQRRKLQFNILIWIVPIAISSWMIGNAMQTTILLTPIDVGFRRTVAGLGAIVGILPVIAAVRRAKAVTGLPIYREGDPRALLGIAVFLFFCVSICATAIGAWAWWIVDAATFAHSKAPFKRLLIPVIEFHSGKGGFEVAIDPYNTGDWTELPISQVDYSRRTSSSRLGRSELLCYPALVQRENDAVRMLKPSKPASNEPVLVPCTAQ
jgi:hypothetical protein